MSQRKPNLINLKIKTALTLFICSLIPFNSNAQSITDSSDAIKTALVKVKSKVTPTTDLKVEYIKATKSAKGNNWQITFRDGEFNYTVTLNATGNSNFKKKLDEDQNNPTFWATLPSPEEVEVGLHYLNKTKNVISKFNSSFSPQDRAIIEYHVCDSPKPGETSEYASGCKNDKPKQWWEVAIKIKTESDEFYRKVEFQNGEPVILSRINVFGNW